MSRIDIVLLAYKNILNSIGVRLGRSTLTLKDQRELDIDLRRSHRLKHPRITAMGAEKIADTQDIEARFRILRETVDDVLTD